jgi:Glycosyltransferase family 87
MATSVSTPAGAGRGLGLRRAGSLLALLAAPAMLAALVVTAGGWHSVGFDYHGGLWTAGRAILDGRSPYAPGALDSMLAHIGAGAPPPRIIELPVYPAPVLLLLAPLALLPAGAANLLVVVLLAALPAIALRLYGVRDPRCVAAAYMAAPVLLGIEIGTLSPALLLGLAAAWRWRDRPGRVGALVAGLVCAKLFLWPVGVWLLATRRYRAAGVAVGAATAATAASWAAIRFAGLGSYPHMISVLSQIEQGQGYSPVAAGLRLGLGATPARGLALAAGAAVLLAAWRTGRSGGDARAHGLTVCAALVLSPIVWLHYFTLLLAPIALSGRRLSALWFAPALLWLTPAEQSLDHPWGIAVALGVLTLVTAYSGPGPDIHDRAAMGAAGVEPATNPL